MGIDLEVLKSEVRYELAKILCKELSDRYEKFENFIGAGIGLNFSMKLMFHEDFEGILDLPKEIHGVPINVEYTTFPELA